MLNKKIKLIAFALTSFELFRHGSPDSVDVKFLNRFVLQILDFAKAWSNYQGSDWIIQYRKKMRPLKGHYGFITYTNDLPAEYALNKYRHLRYSNKALKVVGRGYNISKDERFKKHIHSWGDYCNHIFDVSIKAIKKGR